MQQHHFHTEAPDVGVFVRSYYTDDIEGNRLDTETSLRFILPLLEQTKLLELSQDLPYPLGPPHKPPPPGSSNAHRKTKDKNLKQVRNFAMPSPTRTPPANSEYKRIKETNARQKPRL